MPFLRRLSVVWAIWMLVPWRRVVVVFFHGVHERVPGVREFTLAACGGRASRLAVTAVCGWR